MFCFFIFLYFKFKEFSFEATKVTDIVSNKN